MTLEIDPAHLYLCDHALMSKALEKIMSSPKPYYQAGELIPLDDGVEVKFTCDLLRCDRSGEIKAFSPYFSPQSGQSNVFYCFGSFYREAQEQFSFRSNFSEVIKIVRVPNKNVTALIQKREEMIYEQYFTRLGKLNPQALIESSGEDGFTYFCLAMPRVAGETLYTFLDIQNNLSSIEKLNLCLAILDAFDRQIKSEGMHHEDLNPKNIIVDSRIKLGERQFFVTIIDFGFARKKGERFIAKRGTLEFSAPEQFEVGISTEASDLYALGKIFKEILGQASECDDFLQAMTSADPDDRPTFDQVKKYFEMVLSKENVSQSYMAYPSTLPVNLKPEIEVRTSFGDPGTTRVTADLSPTKSLAALAISPSSPFQAQAGGGTKRKTEERGGTPKKLFGDITNINGPTADHQRQVYC